MIYPLEHTSRRLSNRVLIILSTSTLARYELILNDPERRLLRKPLEDVIRIVLLLSDREVLAALAPTGPTSTFNLLLLLLLMVHLNVRLVDHHLR